MVAVDAAIAACDAEAGRAILTAGVSPKAEAGRPPAVSWVMRFGAPRNGPRTGVPTEGVRGDAFALAQPLPRAGRARGRRGSITIARVGAPFDAAQREMLRYLAGQAAVSLENIELHELVSADAVTDALTGLPTLRACGSCSTTRSSAPSATGTIFACLSWPSTSPAASAGGR